jgi:hypothetical protein
VRSFPSHPRPFSIYLYTLVHPGIKRSLVVEDREFLNRRKPPKVASMPNNCKPLGKMITCSRCLPQEFRCNCPEQNPRRCARLLGQRVEKWGGGTSSAILHSVMFRCARGYCRSGMEHGRHGCPIIEHSSITPFTRRLDRRRTIKSRSGSE